MEFAPDGHLATAGVEGNTVKLWPPISSDSIITQAIATLTVEGKEKEPGCVYRWVELSSDLRACLSFLPLKLFHNLPPPPPPPPPPSLYFIGCHSPPLPVLPG